MDDDDDDAGGGGGGCGGVGKKLGTERCSTSLIIRVKSTKGMLAVTLAAPSNLY